MGFLLPTKSTRNQVEIVKDGVIGLVKGTRELTPWVVPGSETKELNITKIEGDEVSVTFYLKDQDPVVVPMAKENESLLLQIRGVVEKYLIGNDIAPYNPKTQMWDNLPIFDFSKLDDFERSQQPAVSGVGF